LRTQNVNGGTNEDINLITSCFDCNRGKGRTPLSSIPKKLKDRISEEVERESQIKEYKSFISKRRNRIKRDVKKIEGVFKKYHPSQQFTHSFKIFSIGKFLSLLPLHEIENAMYIACEKQKLKNKPEQVIKYFCGICWIKINNKKEETF